MSDCKGIIFRARVNRHISEANNKFRYSEDVSMNRLKKLSCTCTKCECNLLDFTVQIADSDEEIIPKDVEHGCTYELKRHGPDFSFVHISPITAMWRWAPEGTTHCINSIFVKSVIGEKDRYWNSAKNLWGTYLREVRGSVITTRPDPEEAKTEYWLIVYSFVNNEGNPALDAELHAGPVYDFGKDRPIDDLWIVIKTMAITEQVFTGLHNKGPW